MQYLVENGANVDGNKYKSPISRAMKHDHLNIAFHLVCHGAGINETDFRCHDANTNGNWSLGNKMALSLAATYGHVNMVDYLNEKYYQKKKKADAEAKIKVIEESLTQL